MPFLDQRYGHADITGYLIGGNHRVMNFVGRDRVGEPRWEVRCGHCFRYQVLPHRKATMLLESKGTLQCTNAKCRMSQPQPKSETLADIRQCERMEAENAAKAEADRQKAAQIEAAKTRAEQERMEARKSEWREYVTHALLEWDQSLDELPKFPEWESMKSIGLCLIESANILMLRSRQYGEPDGQVADHSETVGQFCPTLARYLL